MNLLQVLREETERLRQSGIPNETLDARLLLQHVLGISHSQLISRHGDEIEQSSIDRFRSLTERRLVGEPVHRILGSREFYGRDFLLNDSALVPRPETELLIDALLSIEFEAVDNLSILEIGTGSGAIAVSLAKELPCANIIATDISSQALECARSNAVQHGVDDRIEFLQSDRFEKVTGMFHVIVSNPPYIPTGDIASLELEVREHDPMLALDGGADGLEFYREIFAKGSTYLQQGGFVLVEFGVGQLADLEAIASDSQLKVVNVYKDLSEIDRAVLLSFK